MVAGILVLGIVFSAIVFQIYQYGHQDLSEPAPAEVVLGAAEFGGVPSNVLRARLDNAVLLFDQHLVPLIVTTGGSERGDMYTEAEVSRTYLLSRGIPGSDIVADASGNDTYQTLVSVNSVLLARGIRKAIFVSDAFHEFRVSQIASSLGIFAIPSPTHTSPIKGFTAVSYYLREAVAVLGAKVVGYKFLSIIRHGS